MIQTLDLPVLSLAVPNIHKLNDINTDNLSCMWTVFSKCKDSLENGRRLENMSWRLWYRESSLKESKTNNITAQLSSTCPIPIHKTNSADPKPTTDKHLSAVSLKRIISSVNENEVFLPPPPQKDTNDSKPNMIMFQKPQQQQSTQNTFIESNKFFIKEEGDSDVEYEDEDDWLSEEEEEEAPTPINNTKPTKKFMISDDEDEEDDDGQYEDIKDDNTECNETAFLSEFRKRSPINVIANKGCSLLSNMLRQAQTDTRLASQPITVVQNQNFGAEMEFDDLSTSMRKCVEWEQHGYQHDFILKSNVKHNTYFMTDEGFRSHW